MRKIFIILGIILLSTLFISCKKDSPILYHLSAGDHVEMIHSRIYLKSEYQEHSITWTSSHPEVISTTGVVTRPVFGEDIISVTMTALMNEKSYTYTFKVMPLTNHEINDLYPSLNDENPIIEIIDYDELLTLLETKQQALIYLGFESCPWCMEYLPIFHRLAKNTGHEVIYYYNFRTVRTVIDDQLNPLFQAIIDLIDDSFLVDHPSISGLKWLYAPTFIGLKDGEIKGLFTGAIEGHQASSSYLTTSQEETLKDIFRNILSAVKPEDPCGC